MGTTDTARDVERDRLPLYVMMVAAGTSSTGNMLTNVAIPWFVLATTGSASRTGIAAAAAVLPAIIAGIFGGTLVDRMGYKRASVIADLASGVTVAMIPLLYLTVGLAFWQLLVLVFLGALLDAPGMTGRQSLLPDLAQRGGMRLEQANSIFGAIQRGASMAGPVLAGVLIAVMGASNVLWVNAATFAFSALAIALAVPAPERVQKSVGDAVGYFAELMEGFRFVQRDRLVMAMMVAITCTNLLLAPMFAVVLPFYANTVFGSAVNLGIMLGGFGGGALVGALLYGAGGHRLPRRMTFMLSFLLSSAMVGWLALLPGVVLATVVLALAGLMGGPLNPLIMTLMQERTPDDMRGRVFGMVMALAWIAMPLGMLLAGLSLEYLGVRGTIIAVTVGTVAASAQLFLNPALREMDAKPSPATT